jgi:Phage Tail Collar Domain
MTADRVFYRGNQLRRVPGKLASDKDTSQFFEEILSWRGHLTRTGQLIRWPSGVTAPDGTLQANGAAVSRTKYAALFSVYGTTIGPGDGSTTFNVPNEAGYLVQI